MKVFTLVMLILGAFIGAGFCSGREVSTYFAHFGNMSYVYCIAFAVLFYFALIIFLNVSKSKCVIKSKCICSFATIVIISSMLAGSVSLGSNVVQSTVLYFATVIITILVCVGGAYNVGRFNIVLVPIMLVVIVSVCLFAKSGGIVHSTSHAVSGLVAVVNYLLFNTLTMGTFLLSVGSGYTTRQIRIASIVSSAIICVVMLAMCHALVNNVETNFVDMPTVELAKNISPALYVICKIVVWCALLTTLIISTYAIIQNMPIYSENKLICIVGVLGICSLISLMGFVRIVKYLYTLLGLIGIVFNLEVMYRYFKKQGKVN